MGRLAGLIITLLCFSEPAMAAGVSCGASAATPGTAESSSVALGLVHMDGSNLPGDTVWQALGGNVIFTLKATTNAPLSGAPTVCFRLDNGEFTGADQVSLQHDDGTGMLTYVATIPPMLASKSSFIDSARTGIVARTAEMQIVLPGANGQQPTVLTRTIGITSVWLSVVLAALAAALAFAFIECVARALNVPGKWLLKVISTRQGVASLSQLQVVLWTFVIGSGAVYVMAISGGLIDISNGALVLLGIAGVTTAGSKLHNAQSDNGQTPSSSSQANRAPSAVTGLAVVAATDSEITLAWVPSAALPPARAFRVDYQPQGGTVWFQAEGSAQTPRCRVVGLKPNTSYSFRVTPYNEFDDGPPASIGPTATTAAPTLPAGAPAQAIGLALSQPPPLNGIGLTWAPVEGATGYVLRARVRSPDSMWTDCGGTKETFQVLSIVGLPQAERYEIQVAARIGDKTGPWSAILTGQPLRTPRWSDLVVRQDDINEVDVTRVQMLFFTVITALFVAMKILATYTIPEIPQGFVLLMGISNGIYLTAKFIPD